MTLPLDKQHLRRLHRMAIDGENGRGPARAWLSHGELLSLTIEARNARSVRERIATLIDRANAAEEKYGPAGAYQQVKERELLVKLLKLLDDGLELPEKPHE